MTIQLHKASKRYNRDWIFRDLSYNFHPGHRYAITGPNGSGKSTLLQILSGAVSINEGSCTHRLRGALIATDQIFKHISFCAPYLELVEEFTLQELLQFHQSFKPFVQGLSIDVIAQEVQLGHVLHKKISEYSSGMKQRAKLAQCIFSDTPLILLDEPCTNLDTAGINLYNDLVYRYGAGRMIVVSSNDQQEYGFCNEVIEMTQYKSEAR